MQLAYFPQGAQDVIGDLVAVEMELPQFREALELAQADMSDAGRVQVQFFEKGKVFNDFESLVGDGGGVQKELPQAEMKAKFLQPGIGDVAAHEIEMLQPLEAGEILQNGIGISIAIEHDAEVRGAASPSDEVPVSAANRGDRLVHVIVGGDGGWDAEKEGKEEGESTHGGTPIGRDKSVAIKLLTFALNHHELSKIARNSRRKATGSRIERNG